MKLKKLEKWEKIRSKGKTRFLCINGVLGWGIITAILWSILMEIIQPSANHYIRPISALLLFPVGGYFWGLWVWKSCEKGYLKSKSDISNSQWK